MILKAHSYSDGSHWLVFPLFISLYSPTACGRDVKESALKIFAKSLSRVFICERFVVGIIRSSITFLWGLSAQTRKVTEYVSITCTLMFDLTIVFMDICVHK